MFSMKQLGFVLALIISIVSAAWAVESRIETRVDTHLSPIRVEVQAIRHLLETYLLQEIQIHKRKAG